MAEANIRGAAPIPIHTLFCIGQNYAAHARELDNPVPETPVVFLKPDTSVVYEAGEVVLPKASHDVHHEVEMVVLLGNGGRNIPRQTALDHVAAYGVGIDVTARDLQADARRLGLPWAVAKGFDTFAPLAELIPAADIADPGQLQLNLTVNGEQRQHSQTADMVFAVDSLIAYLSTIFTLQRGDLIFTGTPAGVQRIVADDVLEAQLLDHQGRPLTTLRVAARDET